ncbi:hypothetical protein N0V95_002054 [Ascochyta clinopodiicola]|nr:hypothetical protein N0V95_002054 [Ascochyta clinopodiicola]
MLSEAFSLTPSNPVATLDYGAEVAGYPTFDVRQTDGRVQIEVKYSEEFHALESNLSDGPWPYAVALANTYRVETFDIKGSGRFNSSLLQGGQRWQSIRLLTSGSVTFAAVGFEASVPVTDLDKLPGGFMCDDESLNRIWKLGARAVGLSCFEKASQKKMWVVNEDGAFVRGMRSGISAKGAFFENYTLEFDSRIERAGLGWVVAHPLASPAKGIQLNLVGNLPANTTFVNTNTSLTPPNSVIIGYGYSFFNQTTLTSYVLDTFNVPFPIQEGTWYRIKTVLSKGEYIAVSIGGRQVFNVSTKSYFVGMSPFPGVQASIPLRGSFGFGGWQD